MTLDVDTTELQAQVGLKAREIDYLKSLVQEKSFLLESYDQEMASLRNQLGWREKSFGGLFGGNRAQAQKFKSISVAIATSQEEIGQLREDIERQEAELTSFIITFLNKNSKNFKRISIELNNHVELYN